MDTIENLESCVARITRIGVQDTAEEIINLNKQFCEESARNDRLETALRAAIYDLEKPSEKIIELDEVRDYLGAFLDHETKINQKPIETIDE